MTRRCWNCGAPNDRAPDPCTLCSWPDGLSLFDNPAYANARLHAEYASGLRKRPKKTAKRRVKKIRICESDGCTTRLRPRQRKWCTTCKSVALAAYRRRWKESRKAQGLPY